MGLLDGGRQFRQLFGQLAIAGGFRGGFSRAWDVTRWITCICSLLGEQKQQKQQKQGRFGQTEERFSIVRGGSRWFVVLRGFTAASGLASLSFSDLQLHTRALIFWSAYRITSFGFGAGG